MSHELTGLVLGQTCYCINGDAVASRQLGDEEGMNEAAGYYIEQKVASGAPQAELRLVLMSPCLAVERRNVAAVGRRSGGRAALRKILRMENEAALLAFEAPVVSKSGVQSWVAIDEQSRLTGFAELTLANALNVTGAWPLFSLLAQLGRQQVKAVDTPTAVVLWSRSLAAQAVIKGDGSIIDYKAEYITNDLERALARNTLQTEFLAARAALPVCYVTPDVPGAVADTGFFPTTPPKSTDRIIDGAGIAAAAGKLSASAGNNLLYSGSEQTFGILTILARIGTAAAVLGSLWFGWVWYAAASGSEAAISSARAATEQATTRLEAIKAVRDETLKYEASMVGHPEAAITHPGIARLIGLLGKARPDNSVVTKIEAKEGRWEIVLTWVFRGDGGNPEAADLAYQTAVGEVTDRLRSGGYARVEHKPSSPPAATADPGPVAAQRNPNALVASGGTDGPAAAVKPKVEAAPARPVVRTIVVTGTF